MIELLALLLGLALVAVTLWDVFETVVVPRPTPGWIRLGRYVVRFSWLLLRSTVGRREGATRDRVLGLFAPAVTIMLLVTWLIGLIVGFGLVLFGLRGSIQPPPDLGSAVYFAASSVLTIGYGDIVATDGMARVVVIAAAASGLGIVALVVTFLFSLYGSYQRREASVVLLSAKAGVPSSAVGLLENLAQMDLQHHLPEYLGEWERWEVEVLDSHVAYPILGYFRSSHDNLSWISALGTVLDAATLLTTTILDIRRGQAELAISLGAHLVEDITNLGFRHGSATGIDRAAFDEVHARLAAAGYRLVPADEAWPAFAATRATYADRLETMANYWAVPTVSWFGGQERLRSVVHAPARPAPARPAPSLAGPAARAGSVVASAAEEIGRVD
jgi:hypothetical protein